MVRLNKTALPPNVNITSDCSYQKGKALDILVEDCYCKCYICEDKPTKINVEHIIPHRSDPSLKYNWDNLFIACGNCNGIKGTHYDNILDPIKCDPEECIDLSINTTNNFVATVDICAKQNDSATMQTVELLQKVYNGIDVTKMQKVECANLLKEHLLPNIRLFMQYILNYKEEPKDGNDILISKELHRSSIYSAFKRKIVRDDPELSAKFAETLQ